MIVFGETRIAAAQRDFEEAARRGREELRRGGDPTWEVYLNCLDRAGLDDESRAAHEQLIEAAAPFSSAGVLNRYEVPVTSD